MVNSSTVQWDVVLRKRLEENLLNKSTCCPHGTSKITRKSVIIRGFSIDTICKHVLRRYCCLTRDENVTTTHENMGGQSMFGHVEMAAAGLKALGTAAAHHITAAVTTNI